MAPLESTVTRKELLERLDAVQAALGPRAHINFNSSLFNDAALLKRIEAFEAKVGEPRRRLPHERQRAADIEGR